MQEPRGLPRLRAHVRQLDEAHLDRDRFGLHLHQRRRRVRRPHRAPCAMRWSARCKTWLAAMQPRRGAGQGRGPPARRRRRGADALRDPRPDPRRCTTRRASSRTPARSPAPTPASTTSSSCTARTTPLPARPPNKSTKSTKSLEGVTPCPPTPRPCATCSSSCTKCSRSPTNTRPCRGTPTSTSTPSTRCWKRAASSPAEVTFPLNINGDEEGCKLDKETHEVTTPKGFKEAYAKYVEGGWPALSCDPAVRRPGPAHRGQPVLLRNAQQRQPGLDHVPRPDARRLRGAARARHAPSRSRLYLPKLTSGEWTGTMCLTEPHCGTDLGLLRTKAEPQADGTYKITGNKIFISAGEHDMASATSSTWCWPACPMRRKAARASACSSCPSSTSTRTAPWASATASTAAAWSTRWASTATPRRRSCWTAPSAPWSASPTRACRRCS